MQVNYLDNRISSFAADFEAATGCAATHPVYAACQVCHVHLLLVHCAFQNAADHVVPAFDESAFAHLTTVGQDAALSQLFGEKNLHNRQCICCKVWSVECYLPASWHSSMTGNDLYSGTCLHGWPDLL